MAQYNLGSMLFKLKQYERSVIYLEEAVRLDPSVKVYHDNMIGAYTLNKQYDDAISQLHKLLQIDPGNYKAYFKLGEIYYMLEKRTEAINAYRMCLQIQPDFAPARNRLQGLTLQ